MALQISCELRRQSAASRCLQRMPTASMSSLFTTSTIVMRDVCRFAGWAGGFGPAVGSTDAGADSDAGCRGAASACRPNNHFSPGKLLNMSRVRCSWKRKGSAGLEILGFPHSAVLYDCLVKVTVHELHRRDTRVGSICLGIQRILTNRQPVCSTHFRHPRAVPRQFRAPMFLSICEGPTSRLNHCYFCTAKQEVLRAPQGLWPSIQCWPLRPGKARPRLACVPFQPVHNVTTSVPARLLGP